MFEVSFGTMRPEIVVAEILLLLEGLVMELSLRHPQQHPRVRISVGETSARASATVSDDGLHVGVSRTELESWMSFFLRYYRDGVAEVDHLDLEAHASDGEAKTVYVLLRVGKFGQPLSGDEARRKLGL